MTDGLKKGYKEAFAKFFENPDRIKFRELLKENTGEYNHIDFKKDWIENDVLAKHILGFANNKGGIIVFGVKENVDGTLISDGLEEIKDKTKIIAGIKKYLPEQISFDIIDFAFTETEYGAIKDKKFQVLIVEDTPEYIPYLSLNNGSNINKNKIYYRGSTNTEEATHEQVQEIISRRIETGYSTGGDNEYKTHLNQLKNLYSMIPKYYNTFPFLGQFIPSLFGQTKNQNYPTEDFEGFINKMIEKKKKIIDSFNK